VALLAGVALARFLFLDAAPAASRSSPAADVAGDRVRQLELAVEADPRDLVSWQALGVAYAQRAIRTGDPALYGLAGQAFDRADELVPSAPETMVGRGVLALSLHDFDRARELALSAHQARPQDADALAVLVDAEVELGDYAAAGQWLQRMLELRPGLPALSRVSYLRQLHGDLDGAAAAMQQAVTAGAGSSFDVAAVTALLGDIHYAGGELATAAERYDDALGIDPDHAAALIGRARVSAARGDLAAAIAVLDELTQRAPRPEALILLADLQRLAGDDAAAAATDEVVRATTTLQRQAGQTVDLETALFEADRAAEPQLALDLARAAYAERPGNVYAADALAWTTMMAGNADAAVPLIEEALRLGTADALVRYHAAEIFAEAGVADRARAELEQVFDLNPWFSFAHYEDAVQLADELDVSAPDV
jgi:tetratricopeptide (TPR) repeat protein